MTTYYVDGDLGDDLNAGTSEGAGNAWATIGKAVTTMVAGDITYVKRLANNQFYDEGVTPTNSGADRQSIISLIGYETTPGDNGKVLWTSTGGAYIITATLINYWYVANFTFEGGTTRQVQFGSDCHIKNCDFWNGGGISSTVDTMLYVAADCIVQQCTFVNPRREALEVGNWCVVVSNWFEGPSVTYTSISNIYGGTQGFFYRNLCRKFKGSNSAIKSAGPSLGGVIAARNTGDFEADTPGPEMMAQTQALGGAVADEIGHYIQDGYYIYNTSNGTNAVNLMGYRRTVSDGGMRQNGSPFTHWNPPPGLVDPFEDLPSDAAADIWVDRDALDFRLGSNSPAKDAGVIPQIGE